jgi:hypothetical protein
MSEFPSVLCKTGELCLMSSGYDTHRRFVVGRHIGRNDQNHLSEVCNVQFVKETPFHDLCETVVMQVRKGMIYCMISYL